MHHRTSLFAFPTDRRRSNLMLKAGQRNLFAQEALRPLSIVSRMPSELTAALRPLSKTGAKKRDNEGEPSCRVCNEEKQQAANDQFDATGSPSKVGNAISA